MTDSMVPPHHSIQTMVEHFRAAISVLASKKNRKFSAVICYKKLDFDRHYDLFLR